jgi:nitrous oxidase accessory protein NosD
MIKKGLAISIILLFLGTLMTSAIAQHTEKPFPPSRGHWLYVGGSGPGNYTKIQDAVNAASAGDTIFVYHDSSPYHENIVINTTLTLLGENQTTTQLDGKSDSHTITVNAPSTVISGFTITQPSNSSVNSNIRLNTNNITIVGNTLMYGNEGIYCINCSNITVKNSIISNVKYGLSLWQTSDSFFENNSISDCYIVANGLTCLKCHFFYNNFSHSSFGVGPQGNYSEYKHNKFFGVGLNSQGMYDDVQYNSFVSCGAYFGAYSGIFAHNIVQNNVEGIALSGVAMNVSYNTIQNCQTGIEVDYGLLTTISHNNFMNNHLDAMFYQSALIRWHGNYWERPLFRPKIIFGYFAYWYIGIPWIFIDWHPAKEPYDIPELR